MPTITSVITYVTAHWQFALGAYVVFAVFGHIALWILYLAVMNLKRARDTYPTALDNPVIRVLGTATLVVGYVLDFLLNVLVHTVLCLELPKETTISARLKRYNEDQNEWVWRRAVAAWFAPLLDPFDPSGNHI
jgi:hypothetical protein